MYSYSVNLVSVEVDATLVDVVDATVVVVVVVVVVVEGSVNSIGLD